MSRFVVINGPNLNLLGMRSESHYGTFNLSDLAKIIEEKFPLDKFEFFQSNIEGEIIDKIQSINGKYDGLVINPGGYAHTSVAIRDALEMCKIPKVEAHLSHLANRDIFRQTLITAGACDGYISGFKEFSYLAAIFIIKGKLEPATDF